MVETGAAPARRDGEIDPRIVQHPLGVIGLGDGWRCGKQRGVETDGARPIVDRDVNVYTLHETRSFFRVVLVGLHSTCAHAVATPWQQFAVRKASKPFMVS